MAEKDLTEKILEDYNDVFADIVNVLVFHGEQRIASSDLRNLSVHSQYKADNDSLHELERDVYKEWISGGIEIAICGLENQTKAERIMPLRVIGYDGAAYRMQALEQTRKIFLPVVTLVLYFGNGHWNQPKALKDILDIPEGLESYINDYKINIFEIAWLSDETIRLFKSDFGIVANFFVNRRKNKDYIPDDPTEIKHVDEVLKLLSVITGDKRYATILTAGDRKGVRSMCDVAARLENIGIEKGMQKGMQKGIQKGQNDLVEAVNSLRKGESDEEILRAGIDEHTLALAKSIR